MSLPVQRSLLVRSLLFLSCSVSSAAFFPRGYLAMTAAAAISTRVFGTVPSIPIPSEPECDSKTVHLIVLVHGWMGNSKEMGYIESRLVKEAKKHSSSRFVIHSAKVNEGRTSDGIAAGGTRLAQEVMEMIESHQGDDKLVTLSFVGNSLGGLYSRYALSKIDSSRIEPMVFCTTATPHLGVSKHTYVRLPRWGEWVAANVMKPTGRDLFRFTPIIEKMTYDPEYRVPLQQFRKRIAYANAYATDFQVPTVTAAFLSRDSPHAHHSMVTSPDSTFALSVETRYDPTYNHSNASMAPALDAMGWSKVFCDNRDSIPLPAIPLPFTSNNGPIPEKSEFNSSELMSLVTGAGSRWNVPLGHQIIVANSKSEWYTRMSAGGQPLVDRMAANLIQDIITYSTTLMENTREPDENGSFTA